VQEQRAAEKRTSRSKLSQRRPAALLVLLATIAAACLLSSSFTLPGAYAVEEAMAGERDGVPLSLEKQAALEGGGLAFDTDEVCPTML